MSVENVTISDQTLADAIAIMAETGFNNDEYEVEVFGRFLRREDSYFGGLFEYTDRMRGIRVFARKNGLNEVNSLTIVDHGYTEFTENDFRNANRKLEALLAK